jgi:hypothetical protein
VRTLLYYSDALPPFARKLLRLDWETGRGEMWSVRDGWTRYSGAKAEILATGDWDPIDPDEVVLVQANMIATDALYAAK